MALAAIKGKKTLAELAQRFDVHRDQITQWRGQLLEGAVGAFGSDTRAETAAPTIDVRCWRMIFCPGRSERRAF